MENLEMQRKIEKSKRYINEPERVNIKLIEVEMKSEHDTRNIKYSSDMKKWECTCDFYSRERYM